MDVVSSAGHPSTAPARKQPGLLRVLALFVSYICHPIFMPTVMTLVLYQLLPAEFKDWTSQEVSTRFKVMNVFQFRLATIVLVTMFFPLFSVLLMKALGFVESIYLRTAKDRVMPLIATMIFYFWAYQVFNNLPGTPLPMKVLLLGCFWGIILLFLGSIFFKISMHTTAAGGTIGIMIVLLLLSPVNLLAGLLLSIVIAGIIGTARLLLKEHTMAEIWMGYAIGLLVQLGAWWYLS